MKNILITARKAMRRQYLRLRLFLQITKNYLYSFTVPIDVTVHVDPYNSQAQNIADTFFRTVRKKCPDLSLYLIGSVGLGLPGQKDVDILAACPRDTFNQYLPKLVSIFGKPKKKKRTSIEWICRKDGYTVEFSLMDPNNISFIEQIHAFEAIRSNTSLFAEYRAIKESANGMPLRTYERRKKQLFNRIMGF